MHRATNGHAPFNGSAKCHVKQQRLTVADLSMSGTIPLLTTTQQSR